jgi:hypothetical protein
VAAWRALLAGLLVIGLTGGLIYVIANDSGLGSSPVPTLATATTAPVITAPPSSVTIGGDSPPEITTTRPPTATSTSAAPAAVLEAMDSALAAWGEFAVTGRMRDLGNHFVSGGPQRRTLRAEAEAIRANPPGPPAYTVTTGDVATVSVSSNDIVLRSEVIWARAGEETRTYTWDIQMRRVDGVWKLLTVEDVIESGD